MSRFEFAEPYLKGMTKKFVEKSNIEMTANDICNQILRNLYRQDYFILLACDDKHIPSSYCIVKLGYDDKGELIAVVTQMFSNNGIDEKDYNEFLEMIKSTGAKRIEFETKREPKAFNRILEKVDKNWKQKSIVFERKFNGQKEE